MCFKIILHHLPPWAIVDEEEKCEVSIVFPPAYGPSYIQETKFLKYMNQEQSYLENHTTHKDETCTVTLVRTCGF